MVFKFATFDPAQDPDDFNPAFPPTPSSSASSATLCQPCEYSCTLTRALVSRLIAAGASLNLTAPAVEFDGDEIPDRSAETPLPSINSDARPKFHQRQLKEFTLKELKVATDKFSDKNIIGRGGFGRVYKGRLADGSLVAIKRCTEEQTFETEVIVGSIEPSHHNLLPMLGFCRASKCRDLLLVYPWMINTDVASCLRERSATQTPLDWPTRRKIAMGVARGLSHLHDLNIVHRDIKAANVLLDEEFEPHIGDLGLAKFINRRHGGCYVDRIEEAPVLPTNESEAGPCSEYSHGTTGVRGTIGHIAPEYLSTGKCSVKADVFAFGIMLLELVTRQTALDLSRLANDVDMRLLDWVYGHLVERSLGILVDPDLQGEYDQEQMEKVIQLALLCAQTVPTRRPSMAQVARMLQGHSIDERWEEYRYSKGYQSYLEYLSYEGQFRSHEHILDDSSSLLSPEELSGPR